jgi:hypothetical protein
MKRRDLWFYIMVGSLSCATLFSQVSPTVTAPNRKIAAPSPSAQRPAGADHPETTAGTIEGYVYWDTRRVLHKPAGTCSGLAITVSVGSSSGPFTAYTPLATLSNNFKYLGQVKEFLAGGVVNVYEVCTYGYNHVPVGADLQVKLTVTDPTAFLPPSTPQYSILGPVKIINAQCASLPPIMNPSFSNLVGHWGSCQDMAYDVNFAMQQLPRPPLVPLDSGGSNVSHLPGAANPGPINLSKGAVNPGPIQQPSGSINPGPIQLSRNVGSPGSIQTPSSTTNARGPLLSPLTQQGMLAGGAKATSPSISTASGSREGHTGPTRGSATLTNADVASMLKAGLSESVIISTIQSAKKNFDFSPAGCQALQQARVSPAIIAVMADGSVRPCSAAIKNGPATPGSKVELNPQPYPPRTDVGSGTAVPKIENISQTSMMQSLKKESPGSLAAVTPGRLPTFKALQKVTNPQLSEHMNAIIAVLNQQKLAADQEFAAITTTAGSANSAATNRTRATTSNLLLAPQNLGPQQTQSAHAGISPSITHAPSMDTTVLTCTNDPTPRVNSVNGKQTAIVFTPERKFNRYTILGCGFGGAQPTNSVSISDPSTFFTPNGFNAKLNIDYWSENAIVAHLDPWLAGVLDYGAVTLTVTPALKPPIKKPGNSFYAARGALAPDGSAQEVPMPYGSMRSKNVDLSAASNVLSAFDAVPKNATQKYQSLSFQGAPVAGWVFRYAYGHDDSENWVNENTSGIAEYYCYINGNVIEQKFEDWSPPCSNFFGSNRYSTSKDWQASAPDHWFTGLWVTGFELSSYNLYVLDTDASQICGAWDDTSKQSGVMGQWDFSVSTSKTLASAIDVRWPLYWCIDKEAEPFNRENIALQSAYGLALYVMGPRCVDPATAHADQDCISKVKQMLSSPPLSGI